MAKILIVDHSPTIGEALSALLRGAGHETSVTAEPGEALAEEARFVPDAILLNVRIPDAFTLVRQWRKQRRQATRLIACTSFDRDKVPGEHLRAVGFDAALGTPLFLADVEKALSGTPS